MNIAIVASPNYPVPPFDGYSGVSRGAYDLSLGLANRGHHVFLCASGDSTITHPRVTRLPTIPAAYCAKGRLDAYTHAAAEKDAETKIIQHLTRLAAEGRINVINLRWERPRVVHAAAKLGIPLISGINCHISHEKMQKMLVPGVTYTAHTHEHKAAIGNHGQIQVVRYGIAMDHIPTSTYSLAQSSELPRLPLLQKLKARGQDYLLHLATIVPHKGQATSIKIAKAANMPLVLAGGPSNFPDMPLEYFEDVIKPQIDNKQVFYFGNANESDKYELMRFAKATFYCSGFEEPNFIEPFGRVLAESTATGTPVIGYRQGSFNELIEDSVTGFGFTTVNEAVQQIKRLEIIDRKACAARARQTMSSKQFIDGIEKLALKLITNQDTAVYKEARQLETASETPTV